MRGARRSGTRPTSASTCATSSSRRASSPTWPGASVADRLSPAVFRLPIERIRDGYYSDNYFNLTKELLEAEGHRPQVVVQAFQKEQSLLGGIDEAIAVLRECAGERGPDGVWMPGWDALEV